MSPDDWKEFANLATNKSERKSGTNRLKVIFLLFLVFGFILASSSSNSFAENEPYVLSHFSEKGTITENNPFGGEVFWTIVSGDQGTLVTSSPSGVTVFRLDMKQSDSCPELSNTVCLDSTVTSIKNSQFSFVKVGDQAKMVFEMPEKQTITMLSGELATLEIQLDISKMRVKDVEKIVEKNIEEEEENSLKQEAWSKLQDALEFIKTPEIQQALKNSNDEFDKLEDPLLVIEQRDEEWILADKDEVTPFMGSIMGNKASELLRNVMNKDKMKPTDFVYEEIILTNRYGANVAQTGKTTDYQQGLEIWWTLAKHQGVNFQSGFDESAGVQSLDMSVRISDENGRFLGVMKFVINTEKQY